MAATDQHYRNQKILDVVFGASCGLMLLTTLWMFMQDYNRSFKSVQRTFRDVEATIAERDMVDRLPDKNEVKEKRNALTRARNELTQARASVASEESRLQAKRESADVKYREIKADLDSITSFYNIAIDEAAKEQDASRVKALTQKAERHETEVRKLETELSEQKSVLDGIDAEIKEKVRDKLDGPEKKLAQAEDDLKKLTGVSDRFAKLAAQKAWGSGDTFRALPILDGFESPTKIKQIWLPDLTIDYSFKEVPRYDRCTTCHLGIDRSTYDKATLAKLGDADENNRLTAKLTTAKEMLERRAEAGENLGFSPDDLPGERQGPLGLITLLMLLCVVVGAGSLGILERSPRLAVRTLAAGLVLTLATSGALAWFSPRATAVKTIKLSPGEITQYAVHPRLDLFVDSNSPHSAEKFGCTICHGGQGSATEFNLASHTPGNARQEDAWKKEHHYHASHYWDYPMLSGRFVESSCVKCHHQMTDLIRHGTKEEAPKLLKGYNLVRENGCFGCHEFQGMKAGKAVGPDMRLEPGPALDLLSAADQEKAKADTANPPGTLRKVGPSLRRMSEKTSLEWTVKWINEPRGFRPDTKMPHFYNLSTNSKEALAKQDELAKKSGAKSVIEQQNFPAAEIHAISHYLMQESKAHLEGKDFYREALLKGKNNLKALQATLVKSGLPDREMKDLFDVSRRFADLALLSSPMLNKTINSNATLQRQYQERLGEMHRRLGILESRGPAGDIEPLRSEIALTGQALAGVTAAIEQAARPVPLSSKLLKDDGSTEDLPGEKEGNAVEGQRLFTEKGCLACHAHAGTGTAQKEGGKTVVPAFTSDANFAPELSMIAAKLNPATARPWLVQWIMNPNVHHPRTRMPVTHLSAKDANHVATWLLSQNKEYRGGVTDPVEPKLQDYKNLARVYLAKAPGITRKELDEYLPLDGTGFGIPKERLAGFARDAEERILEKADNLSPDTLKWYIGKKAIGRLGCYGCHDIPGFETAKPIGTGLNDWGKKDGERLAFEDAESFVKAHFNVVPTRTTRQEIQKRVDALRARESKDLSSSEKTELERLEKRLATEQFFEIKDKKEPFEEIFFRSLEHHGREGFLHLKLAEPRSYDYNRLRPWDDRLRMPQFKFARSRKTDKETPEEYATRLEKEEAEAREAVMTFILGLVAEPIPLKYVNNPSPEKKAEALGRQVLDKYNCASCHQVRPGVYEFKATPENLARLVELHSNERGSASGKGDHVYQNHSAWFGFPQTSDRLQAFGFPRQYFTAEEEESATDTDVFLTTALRFTGTDGIVRDLPAGSSLRMPPSAFTTYAPFGGTWTDRMWRYLGAKNAADFKEAGNARSVLPPPLVREGERVQPDWLYRFLLNPGVIRPESYMILRMPKFNMSPEEARALVNYFSAVAQAGNPGAGITAPYVTVEQRDPEYWKRTIAQYEKSLPPLLADLEKIQKRLEGEQDKLKKDLADPKNAKDVDKIKVRIEARKKEIDLVTGRVKNVKDALALKSKPPEKGSKVEDIYSRQAVRLLGDKQLCLQCHNFGQNLRIDKPKGPDLMLSSERLRPEWVEEWIGHPKRLFTYVPVMPQNFPNQTDPLQWTWQELFVGSPIQQTRAARDLLMEPARLSDLLPTLPPTPPTAKGGTK